MSSLSLNFFVFLIFGVADFVHTNAFETSYNHAKRSTLCTRTNIDYPYLLKSYFSGSNFFDGWDFFNGTDPTHGFVQYVSRDEAESSRLIDTVPAVMRVDSNNYYNSSGRGRKSVRITTKKSWTRGLFIVDLLHVPDSVCGVWPASIDWTFGPNWPDSGEIDIYEGVNRNFNNTFTLHTSNNCTIKYGPQIAKVASEVCDMRFNSSLGCSIQATSPYTYGTGMNYIGGGVYAMEWTSNHIKIWFFPRSRIPVDIIYGIPMPNTWSHPQAYFKGSDMCNIDRHFKNHKIVFDTTFCGDWAGSKYLSDPICIQKGSCAKWIANNPNSFKNVYWEVSYVAVYQKPSVPCYEDFYV